MGAAAMLVGVEMVEAAEAEVRKGWAKRVAAVTSAVVEMVEAAETEVRKGWAKRVAVAETTAEAAGAETEGVQSAAGMGA